MKLRLLGVVLLVAALPLAPQAAAQAPHQVVHRQSSTIGALWLLWHLPVRAQNNAGYARTKFADWKYIGNGCDVRDEVLIDESRVHPIVSSDCHITGRWYSVYDGVWTRDSSMFDIDHLVPLAEAWGSGARYWTQQRRDRFSNDLGYAFSLDAVSASSNRSKGDRDPAQWLPPRHRFWCTYAKRYTAVKWRWNLSVDRAERAELATLIRGCASRAVLRPSRA